MQIQSTDGTLDQWQRTALAKRIKDDIDAYCKKIYSDDRRTHLGASIIGEQCAAKLWFDWRWIKKEDFDGRMLRLFNRGHITEPRFIEWLRGIGFDVQEIDNTGKQFRIYACEGHFGGSCDGKAPNNPYGLPIRFLLEFKTWKSKKFTILTKDGVAKAAPKHHSQIGMYGAALGFNYCVYLAINKDDDDIYVEIVEVNKGIAQDMLRKAEAIIYAKSRPPRVAENPSYYQCKMCHYAALCYHLGSEQVEVNCRSCKFAEPIKGGEWHCHKFNGVIPKDFIPNGCKEHEPIEL